MSKIQQNVVTVLKRMVAQAEASVDDAEAYAENLETMLDELSGYDFFGTEGQTDPRGDGRDGQWSILGEIQGAA
jgi:hypothetical protein